MKKKIAKKRLHQPTIYDWCEDKVDIDALTLNRNKPFWLLNQNSVHHTHTIAHNSNLLTVFFTKKR